MRDSVLGGVFDVIERSESDGQIILRVKGDGAYAAFQNETGGHRWQRIPPTEKRDRVQTSTVTVAVIKGGMKNAFKLNPSDVEEAFMRGSGKGGQNRNKTSTACRLTHRPTGIQVRSENERSQAQNRANAWNELERRLKEIHDTSFSQQLSSDRKQMVGCGARGDKRRTYRERDDVVNDHITGKKATLARVMKGELEALW